MKSWIRIKYLLIVSAIIIACYANSNPVSADTPRGDPWKVLQEQYKNHQFLVENENNKDDPWIKLRKIYLPFTFDEDRDALVNIVSGNKVAKYLVNSLKDYKDIIDNCSERFMIPREIIGAVIMVESSGNPKARAATSSAKGLMQTIDGTFRMARNRLKEAGVMIEDNPFSPKASIWAGSWYLNRMFAQSAVNNPELNLNWKNIDDWKLATQYYYAGPAKGEEKGDIVFIYQDQKEPIIIDKKAYSDKVLHWARVLKK